MSGGVDLTYVVDQRERTRLNPPSVRSKLLEVRKAQVEVEKIREPESAFSWGEAEAVFAKVNPLLDAQRLVPHTSVTSGPTVLGNQNSKVLVAVKLQMTLIDVDAPEGPDRELVSDWASETWLDADTGERGTAAAITSAVKGWYVHTFAVRLLEPSGGQVKRVTPAQVERFIGQARLEANLTDDQVLALANDLVDETLVDISMLPAAVADQLVAKMKEVGADHRARSRTAKQ